MRITLTIPDWAEERNIYVMAGIEMLAYKLASENKLHIKTARCKKCGICCTGLNPQGDNINENGDCMHLEQAGNERICSLGVDRPHLCSVGLQQKDRVKGCSIKYKWRLITRDTKVP